MSQHYFETTRQDQPILVTIGWDRPLQHFFMNIEVVHLPKDANDEDGKHDAYDKPDYLYTHLNERNAFKLDLQYFRKKLEEFGISVPEKMFKQVENDRRMNVGNRHAVYLANGDLATSV